LTLTEGIPFVNVSNVLSEQKKQQIIALGRLRWTLRRIERETGVRRETAAAYLKAAGVALRPPGGWGRRPPAEPANGVIPDSDPAEPANEVTTDSDPAKPANEVITDSDPAKPANEVITDSDPAKPANEVITDSDPAEPVCGVITDFSPAEPVSEVTTGSGGQLLNQPAAEQEPGPQRSPSASACEAFREAIEVGLSKGRNAMAIWQDLVDDCGFSSGYQSVRRFVSKVRGTQSPEACAVIVTAPGEESQVDYGTGPMVRDPASGKYRRTRLFVLTLGYSRKAVRLLVFQSSSRVWAELHEKAFRRPAQRAPRSHAGRGPRQPGRGRAHPGHLRSHSQSPVPGRAGALWRGGDALPCPETQALRLGFGRSFSMPSVLSLSRTQRGLLE